MKKKQNKGPARPVNNAISSKDGLLYRHGTIIDLPEADIVARLYGYLCAERLVQALAGGVTCIARDELVRLQGCSSERMPRVINDRGLRKQYVGIGWVTEGAAKGDETLVVD